MSIRFATFLLAPLAFALSACPSKQDPLACQDACSHQSAKTFCDIDGVYPDSELPNECIAPPSEDACNRIETCTLADKPYCTDDSMGVCVECLDGSHCGDGEVCDPGSHECIVLACTPGSAGDAQCAGADPTLPYCGPAESCVACLENADCVAAADSAVCDLSDFECRGCVANGECDSKVCGTDTGICAAEADIVYVDGDGGADGGSCGTLASPCETIGGGLGQVTASRDTVVVAAGSYDEKLSISNLAVSIVADGVVTVNPNLADGENVLAVSGAAAVIVQGVSLAPASGVAGTDAVSCSGASASLTLQTVEVTNAEDLGIAIDLCTLTVASSTISANDGGGIRINDGNYEIVNNFIVGNGNGASTIGGFRAEGTNDRSELLEFNTFARNVRSGVTGFAIFCDATNLVASNNILMLAEASVAGLTTGDCTHTFSLFDANDATAPTGDNNISDEAAFVDPDNGDFHLQSTSPCIDAADPAATLDTDIDGDIRPQGAARDMGADEAG